MSCSRVVVHLYHNGLFDLLYIWYCYCVDPMWRYNDDIPVVFISFVDSGGSTERISNGVGFSGDVFKLKVVFLEISMPSSSSLI